MATAYDLQIALDYAEALRDYLTKLEEMPLQDIIGDQVDEAEQLIDEITEILAEQRPEPV